MKFTALFICAFLLVGCAGHPVKKDLNSVVTTAVAAANAAVAVQAAVTEIQAAWPQVKKPVVKLKEKYVVKAGDCLYKIAGKPNVLGDPLLWIQIWKANRDLVPNPDLIYPGQNLFVPHERGKFKLDQARGEAKAWPSYESRKKALHGKRRHLGHKIRRA